MREPTRLVQTGALVAATVSLGGCMAESGPWLFGSVALVLATAGGVGVGWLLARQRGDAALHDARQQARLLQDLAGGQVWHSDAQGQVLDPAHDGIDTHGLLAGSVRQPNDPGALDDPAAQALPARLQLPRALPPTVLGPPGQTRRFELRSAPCFDSRGRFTGHLGLTRPLPGNEQADAALAALAAAWPGSLAVLARPDDDAPWRVQHASPAALALFGSAPTLDDATLAAALPTGLCPVAADASAEADGWCARRLQVAGQQLCLLWQADAAAQGEQASLSYTVSHDLRAPIRVVEGFTRIVKEDYGSVLDRIANDHLDRVLGAAARMNQMIDAMLTLARLSSQPLARQPVNLTQLAGYVVDDLRRTAPEREASVQIEPGMLTRGDPTLLRLVLENLLGNAWKYSARRPQTRIEFGRETVDGRNAYVVRDNGAGFDMRSAERLFGLFQRLHSASDFPGTGVGLASVRRIVERHGGQIWADGEPGRGAAFFFTLRDG